MKSQACPDCGAEVGEPHRNECDIERCSKCGGQRISCDCDNQQRERSIWTGEWPSSETDLATSLTVDEEPAFVIYGDISEEKPKPKPPAPPPAPVRHYSDEFRSANARLVWDTHVAEPIYRDGQPTGEWRVARGRFPFWQMAKSIRWETVLPSREAALAWVPSSSKRKEAKR